MKMNRNTQRHRALPGRLYTAVTALLLTISLTGLVACEGNSGLAQSKRIYAESGAQADGKLVIDGKTIELKYAYARRDWRGSPLVDLILANQPIREDTLAEILEVKYQGSNKLRGLWLMFNDSGEYLGERLLPQSGSISSAGGVAMKIVNGIENTRIENDRVRGKLNCKLETAEATTTFAVSFDAPLKLMSSEITIAETPTTSEQLLKAFPNVLPGKWSIEEWRGSKGNSYKGALSVESRLEDGTLRGWFHIDVDDQVKIDEEVSISCQGTKVRMFGRVPPATSWVGDKLMLELNGDLLMGGSTDTMGALSNVVLRKIP